VRSVAARLTGGRTPDHGDAARPEARRLLTVGFLAVVVAGLTLGACGEGSAAQGSAPTGPAPVSMSAASEDASAGLADVLIQPAGFTAMANDPLGGPIASPDDVHRVFADHPEDPQEILIHHFTGGYVRNWTRGGPTPPPLSTAIPSTTVFSAIVLEFASPADARAVVGYFRQRNVADGYALFPVPAQLADGYGGRVQQGPDVPSSLYAVAWTRGNRVFDVAVNYTDPPAGPDEVIAQAVAQDRAARQPR